MGPESAALEDGFLATRPSEKPWAGFVCDTEDPLLSSDDARQTGT